MGQARVLDADHSTAFPLASRIAAATAGARGAARRSLLAAAVTLVQTCSPLLVTGSALMLICAIAAADVVTGAELSLNVFYLLVVIVVSSTGRRALSVGISLFSAAAWLAADAQARGGYDSWFVPLWNFGVRLAVFCICAALVVALVRAAAQEGVLSRCDPLTGLANRRGLQEQAERELARLARKHIPLTVVYLDIDGFKSVNDTHGHAVGDQVLVEVGRTIHHQVRAADVVARVGGDEFAVLLPETDDETARVVTDRLRSALGRLTDANGWPVGFSVGVVTCAPPGPSVQEMLERADRQMYAAKRSGGNRVRREVVGAPGASSGRGR